MSVTVRNRVRRMGVYELPHEVSGSRRLVVGTAPLEGGVRGLRVTTKRVPHSITLTAAGTPGDTLTGLPDALRSVPDIAAAERRGELSIVDETPVLAPASASANEPKPASIDRPAKQARKGGEE